MKRRWILGEWKIPENLLGNPSLPLLTVAIVNLKEPRGVAMDTIICVLMFLSK
jgi:hypothetical protein